VAAGGTDRRWRASWRRMPGGKRTDRISERDLEVLEFVARFGTVPRKVVAHWAGTGKAVTAARERRLRLAGLVEVLPGVGDSGRLVLCTREGLRAVFRGELPVPRFSPGTVRHTAAVAGVAVALEREGHQVLSEREVFAREKAAGERIFSAAITERRFHRPDLIVIEDPVEAIEVELTSKAARRLDRILRSWRRAALERRVGRVRYLCAPAAYGPVVRSASRVKAEAGFNIALLGSLSSGGRPYSARQQRHRPSPSDSKR
jgi:hypothetical protein